MPEEKKTLIMKFGGASVRTPENFLRLADLIIDRKAHYGRIVIVVSAMGGMTDQLIALALQVNPQPPRREYDMLVSVGERISISLLAMSLMARGVQAVSFTGSQSGILTTEAHSEARILAVQPHRLLPPLAEGKVVIVAGFQGMSVAKEITTLGRGGSDTSAVALGVALGAEKVEFYKDVPGIFAEDPFCVAHPTLLRQLTYDEAIQVVHDTGGRVLHARALLLAKKNGLPLHVRSFYACGEEGTYISVPNFPIEKAIYEDPLPTYQTQC